MRLRIRDDLLLGSGITGRWSLRRPPRIAGFRAVRGGVNGKFTEAVVSRESVVVGQGTTAPPSPRLRRAGRMGPAFAKATAGREDGEAMVKG